jgi:hypothetical protein
MTSLSPVGNFLKQLLQLNCLKKHDAMVGKNCVKIKWYLWYFKTNFLKRYTKLKMSRNNVTRLYGVAC